MVLDDGPTRCLTKTNRYRRPPLRPLENSAATRSYRTSWRASSYYLAPPIHAGCPKVQRRIKAVQTGQVTRTFLSRYTTPETRRPGKSPDNTVAKKPSLKAKCHKPVSGAGARDSIAAWATYRLSSLDFPLGDLPAFFFDARPRVEAMLFLPPSFSPLGRSAVDAPPGMGAAPIAAQSGSW